MVSGLQHFNPLPPHGGRPLLFALPALLNVPFQSTPSAWRETRNLYSDTAQNLTFQSTPSAWRETMILHTILTGCTHFNPLPPHGGRLCRCPRGDAVFLFQSTPSAWRETCYRLNQLQNHIRFQSTPSAWRETDQSRGHVGQPMISIHSLRMEGDIPDRTDNVRCGNFNPLPPHGGRPPMRTPSPCSGVFQSTPSAWRETAKLHRKAFFISPILVQSCKKGCKRLHSAPEKMVFFEKREKNLVRNLQHLSVRL